LKMNCLIAGSMLLFALCESLCHRKSGMFKKVIRASG
jgi:hypothetical protein